jgi:hypothetical protein
MNASPLASEAIFFLEALEHLLIGELVVVSGRIRQPAGLRVAVAHRVELRGLGAGPSQLASASATTRRGIYRASIPRKTSVDERTSTATGLRNRRPNTPR